MEEGGHVPELRRGRCRCRPLQCMLRRATSVRRARQDARLLLRPQLRQPAAADISAGGSHRPRWARDPRRMNRCASVPAARPTRRRSSVSSRSPNAPVGLLARSSAWPVGTHAPLDHGLPCTWHEDRVFPPL
ncbi:hypothetical protein MRX96_012543 [Rhipicephalus microplus]